MLQDLNRFFMAIMVCVTATGCFSCSYSSEHPAPAVVVQPAPRPAVVVAPPPPIVVQPAQ
jgi:hypothetical protein